MDLITLIVVILLVLWLAGGMSLASFPAIPGNVLNILLFVVLLLLLLGKR